MTGVLSVPCPMSTGRRIARLRPVFDDLIPVPTPAHPAEHSFTLREVRHLLESFASEDYEDGPRCLLAVLIELELT